MATSHTLHRHGAESNPPTIFYLTTEKLLSLIKKRAKEHHTPQLHNQLAHIRSTCETCQHLSKEPGRFRVSMPQEKCVFHRLAGMDIMSLNRQSVLRIVDHDTKFSAATFLSVDSSANVCQAFLIIMVSTYVGFPDKIMLDQGPQLQSRKFRSPLFAAGIIRTDAGVESNSQLTW